MCGYAALIKRTDSAGNRAVVSRMVATLVHRGPDDSGSYDGGAVVFGFRRLSILDLSAAGHQPMTTPDGQVVLVFNGEIYNFLELRAELGRCGHTFVSSSDTEVLLHAYLEWGSDCVDRLNGMWSFIIHDRRTRKIFGSRDRFGMKPLYFHRRSDAVLFASEIKAIRNSGLYHGGIDQRTCAAYLLQDRLDDTECTFFEGIRQIPAAHAFELDESGHLRTWRYWSIPRDDVPCADPADVFAALFEDAVKLHMRSDVSVGVHLSGGLDSTSIMCAAQRLRTGSEPLTAFCFQAAEYDESRYIEATLKQTGARMVSLQTSPDLLWADLPRVLAVQDEPVHSITPIVGFQLMRLAAEHGCTVVLNGQGADETLAGYRSYFREYWSSLVKERGVSAALKEIRENLAVHGGDTNRQLLLVLQHLLREWLNTNLRVYTRLGHSRRRARLRNISWVGPALIDRLEWEPRNPQRAGIDAALRHSVEHEPLPIYLRVEDRNSMAHSVEARLPFLDYRLVEFAFSLGSHWKMRGPWNKFVLREGMRGRIPDVVRTRQDKLGFPTPTARWIREQLYEPFREVIADITAESEEWLNRADLLERLERHRRGDTDESNLLFTAVQFQLWRRTVVENGTTESVPIASDVRRRIEQCSMHVSGA